LPHLGNVTLRTALLPSLQTPLRLAQPVETRSRFSRRVLVAACRGTPHGIGRLTQLPGGVEQFRSLTFSGQLFETPCRLFDLVGQRSLTLCAAASASLLKSTTPCLTGGFLLLSACQLSQPLGQLVNLLVHVLLVGPTARLVLVGHLVQFELEEIRKIICNGTGPASATPTLLATDLHLHLVLFFGLLQVLQSALFGR
jgi:hypothetical protein